MTRQIGAERGKSERLYALLGQVGKVAQGKASAGCSPKNPRLSKYPAFDMHMHQGRYWIPELPPISETLEDSTCHMGLMSRRNTMLSVNTNRLVTTLYSHTPGVRVLGTPSQP